MYINLVYAYIRLENLKKLYSDFIKNFSYYEKNNYRSNFFMENGKLYLKNTYLYTPKYSNSLIDRVYKMKYLYINDIFINSENYIYENLYINGSYSYFSYMSFSFYNSYSSYYSYNFKNFYSSYSSYSSYNLKDFYSSYSSYNSYNDTLNNSSYNIAYTKNTYYPMINIEIYKQTQAPVYKNKYQYTSCNIEQSFFVSGYGLELI